MTNRLLYAIIMIITTVSCSGGDKSSSLNYKTVKIDTTDMFFTGEYSLNDEIVYFKDCATSKLMNFSSDRIEEINDLYYATAKGTPPFCTLRGEYNADGSVLTVKDFIGFNLTDQCMPITLNRIYAYKNDTLTLTEDYKYTLKTGNSLKLKGNWARMYRDSGVLSVGNGVGIVFTINIGHTYDNNNLFISMDGKDGKGVVFLPIKTIN